MENSLPAPQLIAEEDKRKNFREVLRPYLHRWPWIALSLLIALTIAWLKLRYSSTVYRTESTVLIKEANKSVGSGPELSVANQIGAISGMGTNSVDNEIEIFRSRKLMLSVVRELGLETVIYKPGKFKRTELYKGSAPFTVRVLQEMPKAAYPGLVKATVTNSNVTLHSEYFKGGKITAPLNRAVKLPFGVYMFQTNGDYKGNDDRNTVYELEFMSGMNRARQFLGRLSAYLTDLNTTVIVLSMQSELPEKAEDILNRLAVDYNRDAILDKNSEAQKTADFIDERVRIIGQELGDVENQKESFKRNNNIADIETEANLSLQSGAAAKQREMENEAQLQLTDGLLGYLNRQGSYQVLPLNIGLQDNAIAANIATYNQLIIERNRLLENSTPANPVVQDVTKQINSMRTAIQQSLQKSRQALVVERNALAQEQSRLAGRISKIPQQEKLFRSIERQQTIKEQLYLLLLQKREEAAIALKIAAPKARIVDDALTTGIVAPKRNVYYAVAMALGLLVPLALIYLSELLNNKIKTRADLERLVHGIPVVGEIPSVPSGQKDLVSANDLSPLAEAFRILATNLNFMLPQSGEGRVVMVTSSVKGEGKTFTAVNLALILASASRKVLLIGSDIRNPQLSRYESGQLGKGLTEFLYDPSVTPAEIINTSRNNSFLKVIFSGAIPPNPAELLANGRYAQLVEALKRDYDYIILDTAPLMLVSDSFEIAPLADATVYLTRSGYTTNDLIEFAEYNIRSKKIKNTAFVINDLNKRYFGYGGKYGYGYKYGQSRQNFWEKIKAKF